MKHTVRVAAIAALLALGGLVRAAGAQQRDPRGAIFIARGCNECHSVWALAVKAKSDVAPDLTYAYIDVVNRYGESLEAFLSNPVGIMRMMLAEHVQLSRADRDRITRILATIYLEHRAQLGDETLPIAWKEK
jgi:hypothetical protein